MSNWLIYVRERFPLPVYALLVGGLSLSGLYIASSTFDPRAFLISFVGLMLFFGVLRLMDELKDYQKDIVAHPQRPLPRGILTTTQVANAIRNWTLAMVGFGLAVGAVVDWTAGGLYLFFTAYLWLMYKEFYVGDLLAKSPLLYAITHQIVLLPMCMFTVAAARPELAFSFLSLRYGFVVLGSFFAYEVCRKLDPDAHPILKTYLSMYGPGGVSVLVVVLTAIAARAAARLDLEWWLWPLEILLLMSLGVLFVNQKKFKLVEAAATLSLLFHIWAITFRQWLANWG